MSSLTFVSTKPAVKAHPRFGPDGILVESRPDPVNWAIPKSCTSIVGLCCSRSALTKLPTPELRGITHTRVNTHAYVQLEAVVPVPTDGTAIRASNLSTASVDVSPEVSEIGGDIGQIHRIFVRDHQSASFVSGESCSSQSNEPARRPNPASPALPRRPPAPR